MADKKTIGLNLKRQIKLPEGSNLSKSDYENFLKDSAKILAELDQYFAPSEDVNSLELAHLLPEVDETIIAIYVGINDAVCNKGLVTPFLPRHGHNNVFVYDPHVYSGGKNVPSGTVDARNILNGFCPPNQTWPEEWTYVMIQDTGRTVESLWNEKGYIDTIPAKFEDFTMMTDSSVSKACIFVDPKAFCHPVNLSRDYLKVARDKGQKRWNEFTVPEKIKDEVNGLVPVILEKGEKLYIATTDFGPCQHAMSNIHPDNKQYAVINENSAVPLDLIINKPAVDPKYAKELIPAKGSADMTTDWFYHYKMVVREPLLMGLAKG